MDKNTIVVVILCIAAVGLAGCTQNAAPPVTPVPTTLLPVQSETTVSADAQTCSADSDCVPVQCCHPTSCVNKASISRVCNLMCTQGCTGPLDCGAGSCGCGSNGKCTVVPAPTGTPSIVSKTSVSLAASPRQYSLSMSSVPGIGITATGNGFDAGRSRFVWTATYGHFLSWGAVNYTPTDVGNPATNHGEKLYWTYTQQPASTTEPVLITVTATDPATGRILGTADLVIDWDGTNGVILKSVL